MSAIKLLTILVLEDNPMDKELLIEELRYLKVVNTLHFAATGAEALDFLQRRTEETRDAPRPDLVLLDIHLPDCLGHDILDAIRADADLSGLQVVMLTSSKSDEDILRAHGAGADSYLVKPIRQQGIINLCGALAGFGCAIVVHDEDHDAA